MTVSTTTTKNSYSGNGTLHSFAYNFKIFADADLSVVVRSAAGAETTKTLNTHYIVTNAGTDTGGNVLFKFNTGTSSDAHHSTSDFRPASGETVVISRALTLTQGTDYVANDPFPATSHENALDRLTMITQQQQEELDRTIKASVTNTISGAEFTTSASDRANKVMSFDGSGDLTVTSGKVDTVSVTVSGLTTGASPTASATFTATSGALALALGIPAGATGATGPAGGGLANVVEDTSPQLGGNLDTNSQNILIDDAHFIGDESGNEQIVFQTTGSAVNHLEITNNASGSNPILSAAGDDTNIGIALTPKGTGEIVIAASNLNYGGTAVSATGAEINKLAGAGTLKQAGKESIWIPAAAMYPSTTNPCSDLTQVETTALRPDLKVLDFAAAADDFAQFSIAFPKSYNLGTITYQPFWTVTGTDTGTVVWQLGGVAITNDESINTAFGTLVATAAKAHSGTSNDLMVSNESGAVTIAGSPADDDQCFFQINLDTSASGQTGVVRLLGVKLFFTTDAANDS